MAQRRAAIASAVSWHSATHRFRFEDAGILRRAMNAKRARDVDTMYSGDGKYHVLPRGVKFHYF